MILMKIYTKTGDDGETGLLVPPKSPQDLSAAIVSLLEDVGRAAQLGRAGRDKAHQEFGWSRYLQQLNALYERLLDGE